MKTDSSSGQHRGPGEQPQCEWKSMTAASWNTKETCRTGRAGVCRAPRASYSSTNPHSYNE